MFIFMCTIWNKLIFKIQNLVGVILINFLTIWWSLLQDLMAQVQLSAAHSYSFFILNICILPIYCCIIYNSHLFFLQLCFFKLSIILSQHLLFEIKQQKLSCKTEWTPQLLTFFLHSYFVQSHIWLELANILASYKKD